jgi:hypothetical protein
VSEGSTQFHFHSFSDFVFPRFFSFFFCLPQMAQTRASMLLAGPEPTDALGVFVESRAPLLFTSLFGVSFDR